MSPLVLYSYYRSSCSYRVRIVLSLKHLAYETVAIHLVRGGGEQHQDDYRSLNPMGQVPCLIHEGTAISQSMAITEYLDTVFPEPRVIPEDPASAAKVRQICEHINSGIQPLQNLKVLQHLARRYHLGDENKAEWASHWIRQGFVALEKVLLECSASFCVGDDVTAADCFLVPQVYNAVRFKIDMDHFPSIQRVHQNCIQIEAFKQAHPAVQPDTPLDQ